MLAAQAAPPVAIIGIHKRTGHASPTAVAIAKANPQIKTVPPKHSAVQASELATP
jgi:hypothetical protein